MYYNIKKEKIVYKSIAFEEKVVNVHLAGFTMTNPNYKIQHENFIEENNRYQFEFVTKGKGYIKFNNETFEFNKGDFFFINKYAGISYYSDKNEPVEKMFITVTGSLIDSFINVYNIKEPFFIMKIDVCENFTNILNCLEKATQNSSEEFNKVSVELLKIIQKVFAGKNNFKEIKPKCTAEKIISFIDQNIYRKLTLEEVSHYFCLSKAQIIRIFKQKYEISPAQYIINKRIALSMYYLEKTQISIIALSDILAFSDSKHFSKTFKKIIGKSPSQYRKEAYKIEDISIDALSKEINK